MARKPFASICAAALACIFLGTTFSVAFAADASPSPSAASSSPSPASVSDEDPAMTALATSLVAQAQSGKIDRSLFEAKTSEALTQAMVDNVAQHMAGLGKPKSITFESHKIVGEFSAYHYRIAWEAVAVDESFALNSAGKIVGWYFQPAT